MSTIEEKYNFIKHPESMQAYQMVIPAGGYSMGNFYVGGGTWGVSMHTRLEGETTTLVFACEKALLPKDGSAIAVGKPVWLNTTTAVVSETAAAGDIMVGTAVESALAGDDKVMCAYDTRLAFTAVTT